ncbi:diacylglycerol kinase family enzyme [Paenarthrobacter sp. TE4293]|uniref:diacylglycerol kinase family protein n=1 Tax=Paenarthrobacter sp. TE4293 TaxID=3381695 RepID=UPI003D226016
MMAPPRVRSAAVVINAASRRGAAASQLAVDAMKQSGVPVCSVHPVTSGAGLFDALRQVISERHDLVVVGGGDGTVTSAAGLLAGTMDLDHVLQVAAGNGKHYGDGNMVAPMAGP